MPYELVDHVFNEIVIASAKDDPTMRRKVTRFCYRQAKIKRKTVFQGEITAQR